jgi:peptide deformylase
MAILTIIEKGNPVLENKTIDIPVAEILSTEVQTVIRDMKETLASISDGVGLAAPQIGISLPIFLVSKRVFEKKSKTKTEQKEEQDLVCINPHITKFSKAKKWLPGEGCLSVRWFYGKVYRSTHVTLEYYDEKGVKQVRGAGGILSHIFQHECDHLKGELFIDKAKDVEWLEPEVEGKIENKTDTNK